MKVAVAGGGAAGMMAAYQAALQGAEVTLIEQNEKLGKKLYITGKGRCNLTNDTERESFFHHIYRNPRFLYSSFAAFDNRAVQDMFETAGLPLKVERGGRVFPASDKSSDVIAALRRLLDQAGVRLLLNTKVSSLLKEEGRITGLLLKGGGDEKKLPADRVILALGGLSYPSTGSTGDGFKLAEAMGHKIMPLKPSLVPLRAIFGGEAKDFPIRELAGLSLKNVALQGSIGKKKLFQEQGEMLFTHEGISGPLVLSLSAFLGDVKPKELSLSIDLKPALSREQLSERMIRESAQAGSKSLANFLRGYLPAALVPVILALTALEGASKASQMKKEDRLKLVETLKQLSLRFLSLGGYEEAVVTRGGVHVKEVDPATMESKLIKGLYFAGEMLDLDASTGGFNLQIAWTTGAAAGRAAAKEDKMTEKRANRHIAIDGPASSGKSTIAKRVARETGLIYVDTGAMFRAMAVYFLRQGLSQDDEAGIAAACEKVEISIEYQESAQQVVLNGENVTPLLRDEAVGQMASASSVFAPVREKMKALQQRLAAEKDVVMDGRDIGTVILPDAFLKIYMTASVEVRAKRRYEELLAKGQEADYETVAREIRERDERDMNRPIAPLKQAEDAVLLDTSDLDIDEVTKRVLTLYREKG